MKILLFSLVILLSACSTAFVPQRYDPLLAPQSPGGDAGGAAAGDGCGR